MPRREDRNFQMKGVRKLRSKVLEHVFAGEGVGSGSVPKAKKILKTLETD